MHALSPAGRSVYVILHGSVEVRHKPATDEAANTHAPSVRRGSLAAVIEDDAARHLGEKVGSIPAGECFGELSSSDRFRDASVLSMGSVDDSNTPGKAVLVQIEEAGTRVCHAARGTVAQLTSFAPSALKFCRTRLFRKAKAAVAARTQALAPLYIFRDWPIEEVAFLAHWCHERTFTKGEAVYRTGEKVRLVYFLQQGAVSVWKPHRKRPKTGLAVEYVVAPMFFGEMETVQQARQNTRIHTVLVEDENTTALVVPVHVFRALALSDVRTRCATMVLWLCLTESHRRQVPRLAFFTEMQLKGLRRDRAAWHQMRIDDMELGEADVPPALLGEVQVQWAPHRKA